ncbi:MAG: response regulator [Opitutaceae bacterium]|nr:response regulator [Opitutaceae bacterium]
METPPATTPVPPARTLLVIDDERSVRETLRLLLERRDYRVLVAENGAAGLALAATNVVDGAMVDVHMPGVDGVTVCRTLRAQAEAAGRPLAVWLMSGARSAEVIKAGTEAGAAAVLGKPFNLPQLFDMLGRHFNPPAPEGAPTEPPALGRLDV